MANPVNRRPVSRGRLRGSMKKKRKRRKATLKRRQRSVRKNRTAPRTAQQYSARSSRFQDLWDKVVAVISNLRSQKTSLQKATREMGVSPRTVVKYGGSALQKGKRGRYAAKKSDRLLRMLMVPSPEGPREIAVPNSSTATLIGKYWNAVYRYLDTGDTSGIVKFAGKHISDAEGKRVDLLTRLADLDRLASAGVLSFESLYARTT